MDAGRLIAVIYILVFLFAAIAWFLEVLVSVIAEILCTLKRCKEKRDEK